MLAGIVLGSVFTTIYSLRFLWGAFARKGWPQPSKRVAEMHRPPVDVPRPRRRSWPPQAWSFGLWPSPLDHALDGYADTVPGGRGLRPGAVARLGLPLLLSALVLAIGTAAFFGSGTAAPDAGSATCRWATPTASTTR